MPKYRITAPDGRQYDVTAPDGATQDQVLAYVQTQHAQAAPKPAATPHAPSPEALARAQYDAMNPLQRIGVSAGGEAMSMARGIGQLLTPDGSAVNKRLTAAADADAPMQDAQHGITNVVGRTLPYLATLPFGGEAGAAARVIGNGGRIARLAAGATEGAAYGAAQEARTGDSRTQNMLLGAGLGAAGHLAADALRGLGARAANAIPDNVRAVYEKARALGIDLTPAQLSDSRLVKYMQHQFGLLPFSGAQATGERQVGQWNRRLASAIGVDAPVVTPEVYANKKGADSALFDDLAGRNTLTVTPELARNLHTIAQQAKAGGSELHDTVNSAIDGLYSQMQDGKVPGRAYQMLDSTLSGLTKGGDTKAHFIGMVRDAIRNAMDASISPEDAAAWKQLRQQYANRKTITAIVDPNGGPISPQALMARVKATKAGKERMATGAGGALGDLAAVGQQMKPPPSSGTGERMLVNELANPFKWPGLALGASVGRAANSNLLARQLMRKGRGQTANRLAPVLARAPWLIPFLAEQQPADADPSP